MVTEAIINAEEDKGARDGKYDLILQVSEAVAWSVEKQTHLGNQHEPVIGLEAFGHESSNITSENDGKPRENKESNGSGYESTTIAL